MFAERCVRGCVQSCVRAPFPGLFAVFGPFRYFPVFGCARALAGCVRMFAVFAGGFYRGVRCVRAVLYVHLCSVFCVRGAATIRTSQGMQQCGRSARHHHPRARTQNVSSLADPENKASRHWPTPTTRRLSEDLHGFPSRFRAVSKPASAQFLPTLDRLSTITRPTLDRHSTDARPTLDPHSTDARPTLDLSAMASLRGLRGASREGEAPRARPARPRCEACKRGPARPEARPA